VPFFHLAIYSQYTELLQSIDQLAQAAGKAVIAIYHHRIHQSFPAKRWELVQPWPMLFGSADTSIHEFTGDWGDIDAHDRSENQVSLEHGFRLMSVYSLSTGVKIWVITEAGRSSTCILLPEEY
jgi:hypothetical protein